MKDEALKLALDTLENSVDLVFEAHTEAVRRYGDYPSRKGKIDGLKVLADAHQGAIDAVKAALAQPDHIVSAGNMVTHEWVEERAHRRCKRYVFIDTETPYQFDAHTLMDLARDIEAKLKERNT